MKIFISIVSHGHTDFIVKNKDLLTINMQKNVYVVIKDNKRSVFLRKYCEKHDFHYLPSKKPFGLVKYVIFKFLEIIVRTVKM